MWYSKALSWPNSVNSKIPVYFTRCRVRLALSTSEESLCAEWTLTSESLWKEPMDSSVSTHTAHLIRNQSSTSLLMKLSYLIAVLQKWGDFSPCLSNQMRKLPPLLWKKVSFMMNIFQADCSRQAMEWPADSQSFNRYQDGIKWNYVASFWKSFCIQHLILSEIVS